MSASQTIDAVLVIPVGLAFLFAIAWWLGSILAFIPAGYRHIRYTRNGLCPTCHKPAAHKVTPVDQIYSSQTTHLACSCGATSLLMGDRHAAEW